VVSIRFLVISQQRFGSEERNCFPLVEQKENLVPTLACAGILSSVSEDEDRGGAIHDEEAESCFSHTYQGLGPEGSVTSPASL